MEYVSDIEKMAQEVYQEQCGGQEAQDTSQDKIPPSSIPEQLEILSEDQRQERCRVIMPREQTPPYVQKNISEDEEDKDSEKRSWKRSRLEKDRTGVERQKDRRKPSMFDLPLDEEEEEDQPIPSGSQANGTKCPVVGCDWKARRLRNHVNRMHLPRIMWDNHSPPVNPDRYEELNKIRGNVLVFLARHLVGTDNIFDLLRWCREEAFIPYRASVLGRHIEQMRSLTNTLGWSKPSYNRYNLYSPNHTSVLIHWRYQVAMLKKLPPEARLTYFNFGLEFMSTPTNFVPPISKRNRGETILSNSLLAPIASKNPQPEWDEGCQPAKEPEWIVVVEECGKPDDMEMEPEVVSEEEEPDIQGTVTIGPQQYTLVLRGSTLDISGTVLRRPSTESVEEAMDEVDNTRWEAFDVYDSHLHLDRSSKRLLGNLALSMDDWMNEPMERPPTTPVNVIGGTLVYCDPEKYPKSIPIQDKWKVAIGVHPKKVHTITEAQVEQFISLIGSQRVTAVGELGIDRTVNYRHWDGQLQFLVRVAPYIQAVNKPIIFHIRSNRFDPHSQLTYMVLLKFCVDHFPANQKCILHCFTGTTVIQQAWLHHFENTYFGFTYLVDKFSEIQLQALKDIPSNRLLVETDAPYITPPGISTNSPIYIGETIAKIAKARKVDTEQICRITTINAGALFGLG